MKLNKLFALLLLTFPIAFASCQKSDGEVAEKNSVNGTFFLEEGAKVDFQDKCYIYKDTEGSLELEILGGETPTGGHYCMAISLPKGAFFEGDKKLDFTDKCKVLVSFRTISGSVIFVHSEHQAMAELNGTLSYAGIESLFKYGNILSGALDITLSLDNGDKIYLSFNNFTIASARDQFADPTTVRE